MYKIILSNEQVNHLYFNSLSIRNESIVKSRRQGKAFTLFYVSENSTRV